MPPKKERVERICQSCGKTFLVLESQIKRPNRGRFCSTACKAREHVKWLNENRKPATQNAGWFSKGSGTGQANHKWVAPVKLTCKQCGESFERKPWMLRRPMNTGEFCSVKCRSASFKGAGSPLWLGGEQTYRGRNWKQIRLIVVTNQGGVCADCGKLVGSNLPVHHIKPFREFQTTTEANDLSNLIGLCQSCHMKRERPARKV